MLIKVVTLTQIHLSCEAVPPPSPCWLSVLSGFVLILLSVWDTASEPFFYFPNC